MASLWLALALWASAAVSESRLFSQPALLAAAWVALFTLPPAYAMCRCDLSAKCQVSACNVQYQNSSLPPGCPGHTAARLRAVQVQHSSRVESAGTL